EFIYMGGEQAAWWAPMAIAVIAGLVFATALTLILVPVLYLLFNRMGDYLKTVFKAPTVEAENSLQQA
ncbi:efflux RND transporter permease subunit, partial [Arthrospira platensis SPKY1]|nr:efflux RND transporter permease subunit [Arthrospira platensis SPKY1]